MQTNALSRRAPSHGAYWRSNGSFKQQPMSHVVNRQLTVIASASQQSARQTAAALLTAATVLTSGAVTPGVSAAFDNLTTQQVGVHVVRDSAATVAGHMPLAGLLGSSDVSNSYDNFHQLKATDIDGSEVNFADLNGKDFVTLYQNFHEKGLALVAFPCNQFGFQEPGNSEQIKNFASGKGFKGLLMEKIDVNGPKASPVYSFLKEASGDTSPIPWNFAKFLVRKDGTVFGRYGPKTGADDLTPLIEQLLAEEK